MRAVADLSSKDPPGLDRLLRSPSVCPRRHPWPPLSPARPSPAQTPPAASRRHDAVRVPVIKCVTPVPRLAVVFGPARGGLAAPAASPRGRRAPGSAWAWTRQRSRSGRATGCASARPYVSHRPGGGTPHHLASTFRRDRGPAPCQARPGRFACRRTASGTKGTRSVSQPTKLRRHPPPPQTGSPGISGGRPSYLERYRGRNEATPRWPTPAGSGSLPPCFGAAVARAQRSRWR